MGKTSSIVKDRYNKKAYDEIKIRVSKGEKEKIQLHATTIGESLNAFVNRAIDEAMQRDVSTPNTTPTKKDAPQQSIPTVLIISQEKNPVETEKVTKKKRKMTKNAARKIIQDKMDVLRAENRAEEYDVVLHDLLTMAPKNKADFMRILKDADIKDQAMIEALLIFHGLKGGE